MDIAEYIYEGVVEPSYKQSNSAYSTRSGHNSKNIWEYTSSHTYSVMSESSDKDRKRYVDHP